MVSNYYKFAKNLIKIITRRGFAIGQISFMTFRNFEEYDILEHKDIQDIKIYDANNN